MSDQAAIARLTCHSPEANAKRKATIRRRVELGLWNKTPRHGDRIKWFCEQCGVEKETLPSQQLRFCSHRCAQLASRGRKRQDCKRRVIAPCCLCLRKLGYGSGRIASTLGIGKATVSKMFRENAIAIDPKRNGYALKGTGEIFRPKVGTALWSMRCRVRKCLGGVHHCRRRKRPRRWASYKERYDNDPQFKIKHLLRKRIRKVLQGARKRASTSELVGCSWEHLMAHMQAQFKRGMSWKNLGVGRGNWSTDHIIPCDSFDLTNPEQQRICFHWTNLRPMWAVANCRKGARITNRQQHFRFCTVGVSEAGSEARTAC